MAITVTPKYKPFTYEELVKPLEGYWKKYDEAEKELGTLQNDVAKVKSIIETAPENDPIRIQALDLYNQLQKEVDALAIEGYTARGRKARLDLKNTFNTLIPRILTAEEAVRKDRIEYSKMDRSGRYIMANSSDNPYAYTWRDYIDGQIPQYTTGIEKAQAYKAGKDAATLISSRVVKDPTFTPKNGYTAITTELGLQYDNADEMMKNQDIATAVENIVNNYTQGSDWSDISKEALRQEVIRGAYEGLVHKTNTQYQRTKTDSDVTFEQRYTKDGNIAFINPKTGKVVRTETPEGVIVDLSKKRDNDSQDTIQKVLGSEALPIGDVRFAGRVSSRKDYLSADGKLNTEQLITNYGDTNLKKTKQVRLANASETQNALQNLIKDVIKKYTISGFKSQAEAMDYINNNYIVMIEGGKGPGSQDNHVYAVPIQQAVEQLVQNKDYKDSKKKLKEFRDQQSPNSTAYNAFDSAYKMVNIYDYASQLSAYLKNAKEEDLLGKTVDEVLNDDNLRLLGLSEQEIAFALTELDDEARKIFQNLLKKEQKKPAKKLEKPSGTIPKTMG